MTRENSIRRLHSHHTDPRSQVGAEAECMATLGSAVPGPLQTWELSPLPRLAIDSQLVLGSSAHGRVLGLPWKTPWPKLHWILGGSGSGGGNEHVYIKDRMDLCGWGTGGQGGGCWKRQVERWRGGGGAPF